MMLNHFFSWSRNIYYKNPFIKKTGYFITIHNGTMTVVVMGFDEEYTRAVLLHMDQQEYKYAINIPMKIFDIITHTRNQFYECKLTIPYVIIHTSDISCVQNMKKNVILSSIRTAIIHYDTIDDQRRKESGKVITEYIEENHMFIHKNFSDDVFFNECVAQCLCDDDDSTCSFRECIYLICIIMKWSKMGNDLSIKSQV
jgi:hypothetical protein